MRPKDSPTETEGRLRVSRPVIDPSGEAAVRAFVQAGGDASREDVREIVSLLGQHARAMLPLALGDPHLPRDVIARPLERDDDEAFFRAIFQESTRDFSDGPELRRTLRRLRHRAIVRIALREVLRLADIDRTSAEMAWLAAAAVDAALDACKRTVLDAHPDVRDAASALPPLVVLGMGKLGGRELNLGSDIDLCFFCGAQDEAFSSAHTTAHEIYTRVATRTVSALADVTEDGFCFRVDLRLRPHGSRGPLVAPQPMAERYYEHWGRSWERAALLRAKPIAGDLIFGARLMEALRPFVFRRSVDPTIARDMAEMLERSRRELNVDSSHDIKLGHGGIREAEFFVQTLQLIWGGPHPELRVSGTVDALRRLSTAGLVTRREANQIEEDWALLRRVEHRIHMQAGYQTHALPRSGPERESFAVSLGYADGAALDAALGAARARIADSFASLEAPPSTAPNELEMLCEALAGGAASTEVKELVARALPFGDADEVTSHLVRLAKQTYGPFGPLGRERARGFGVALLAEVAAADDPVTALRHLADFLTRIGGSWGYDKLLADEPILRRRLVALFGASLTLSSALIGHPEALDHLIRVTGAPNEEAIRAAHREPPLDVDGELPDPELFVSALRRLKRELTLQIGLAFVANDIDLQGLEALLTMLAEAQIAAALDYATSETYARFGQRPSQLIIAGMGKLGGRELGFGGDLDLLFLYGADPDEEAVASERAITAAEVFTRIAQRTLRLLSQPDAEGTGYSTDARLRPGGSKGTLVVSLAAFERYHSTQAADWERQALVRARPIAGDPELCTVFAERFAHYAFEQGPPAPEEVASMRKRMQAELAREGHGRYHAKLGYGGLIDVEFLVQWLQMRHGKNHALRSPSTLEALRALRAAGHLAIPDAEALEEGYRFFRGIEQAVRFFSEVSEPVLIERGPAAERVARRLGIRERDGEAPAEVLFSTWRRYAEEVRGIFERLVAPVEMHAPWGAA